MTASSPSFTLPRWDAGRFQVPADAALLERLTRDMAARGGDLKPAPDWLNLDGARVHGAMAEMLDPWCGILGQAPLVPLAAIPNIAGLDIFIPLYEQYLRRIDHLGLLDGVTLDDLGAAGWRVLDLESLMDFLLLTAFFDFDRPDLTIIEIGGGFGRLIEFLIAVTGRRFRYINIDAVPVSLMYCHEYLTARFPGRSVRIFDPAQGEADEADFLIVPAWDLPAFRAPAADLAINIESMQEMSQSLVDFYIGFLDRTVADGGMIFLNNSREHEFIGDWEFPDTWRRLFQARTARSWTNDHPTEIFLKTSTSQKGINRVRAETYRRELAYVRLAEDLMLQAGRSLSPHGFVELLQSGDPEAGRE